MTRLRSAAWTGALVVVLAACGSTVSASEVESQISLVIEDEVGLAPDSVKCPEEELSAEEGATQKCQVAVTNGTYEATVEVQRVEDGVADLSIEVDEEPLE